MKKKTKLTILINIFLLITLVSGGILLSYFYSLKTAEKDFDNLAETFYQPQKEVTREKELVENKDRSKIEEKNSFLELKEKNSHIVGWISIPDTKVNYPLVHTPDDPEYYLHRNFDQEYSISGTPFMDAKSSINPPSDNILIHGHNMKDGSMFGQLPLYKNKEFLDQHPSIKLFTSTTTRLYDIIGVIPTSVYKDRNEEFDYHNFINAKDEEEFNKYISDVKKYSLFDTGLTAHYGEELLTLSTCAYHTTHGRFVIVAKLQGGK